MIFDKIGHTGITTNAHNIDDGYIQLFKKYKTYVGISCDGPEGLNTLRGPNPQNVNVTKGYNRKLKKILRKLRKSKIDVSMMCILHTENAGNEDKLERLKEWVLWLSDMGITGGRFNPLYAMPWQSGYQLDNDRLLTAWRELTNLTFDYNLRWNPIREMQDSLLGFSVSPCTFGQCDLFQTSTISILPDGTISNCDRTFEYGLHLRSETDLCSGRYQALETDQCKDCKFLNLCNGGCPSEGVNGDWRNKSRFCEAYYGLYEHIGQKIKGLFPNVMLITEGTEREPFKLMSYRYSSKPSVYGAAPLVENCPPVPTVQQTEYRPHGDHYDETRRTTQPERRINRPHGDHYDEALRR